MYMLYYNVGLQYVMQLLGVDWLRVVCRLQIVLMCR